MYLLGFSVAKPICNPKLSTQHSKLYLYTMPIPYVSILLPVYNGEATLRGAVDSLLGQDYAQFELLLVDNASTDGTAEIIREYANRDVRVRALYEPRQGIAFALNHGLREAKGRYVARMDADDVSLPGRLRRQVDFLDQHPEIGMVAGLVEYDTAAAVSEGYAEYVKQLNRWDTEERMYRHRFVESPFAHPSVMFRKALVDTYGYYTETGNEPEDYELWLRWYRHGVRMAKLPHPVLRWVDSPGRLSRVASYCSAEALDGLRYRYLAQWLKEQKNLPPLYIWGGGKLANAKMKLLQTLSGIPIAGIIDLREKKNTPLPHICYLDLPEPGNVFVVSMVSNRGKYQEIDAFLMQRGYVCGRDYVLAQ